MNRMGKADPVRRSEQSRSFFAARIDDSFLRRDLNSHVVKLFRRLVTRGEGMYKSAPSAGCPLQRVSLMCLLHCGEATAGRKGVLDPDRTLSKPPKGHAQDRTCSACGEVLERDVNHLLECKGVATRDHCSQPCSAEFRPL